MNTTVYNTNKVHSTWFMLKLVYTIVPITIGLDKCFTWFIVNWAQYTSPLIMLLLPITTFQFILITGIIEIIAGAMVWFYPRFGAYLIVAWMVLVIIDLASMNRFYDIIARDIVIAVGALALAWLTEGLEK